MNYEHPFPRVSGYYRVCDMMEVNITEFRVYHACGNQSARGRFVVLTWMHGTREFVYHVTLWNTTKYISITTMTSM